MNSMAVVYALLVIRWGSGLDGGRTWQSVPEFMKEDVAKELNARGYGKHGKKLESAE